MRETVLAGQTAGSGGDCGEWDSTCPIQREVDFQSLPCGNVGLRDFWDVVRVLSRKAINTDFN